jgi:hypothetical protein
MANLNLFLGECTSCSFRVGGLPRKEVEEVGKYDCYQCGENKDGPHKRKFYFGYDITVCIGNCDKEWGERKDNHGFSRK